MSRRYQVIIVSQLVLWSTYAIWKSRDTQSHNADVKIVQQSNPPQGLNRIEDRVEALVWHCRQFASPYQWSLSKATGEQEPLATISMSDSDGAFEDEPRIDFIYRREKDVWIPHALSWNDAATRDFVELNVNKLCDVKLLEEEFRIMMLIGN